MTDFNNELMISTELLKSIPMEAQITRIEYEGPTLAIYTRNPLIFFESPSLISSLATKFKRRFVIRSEPRIRKDPHEARHIIENIFKAEDIPRERYRMFFDESRGEVIIFISQYLTNDLRHRITTAIVKETAWIPVFRWYFKEVPKVFSRIYYKPKSKREPLRFLSAVGNRVFRPSINPSKAIRITALGGAEEVGRSATLISTTESKILIDFGLKVNVESREAAYPRIDLLDTDINEIDAVIVTHAHLDHSGLIPFLYKHGYRGPVYMTEPTLPLSILLQEDLINLSKKGSGASPYNEQDIHNMIRHTITLKYNQVTDISPDIKLTFFNAGHILGSAMVHLHITEGVYNILLTGDFKFGQTRLLDPAKSDFTRAETLVMESTYGGRYDILPPRKDVEALFSLVVRKTLERGGKALIPVPGVGRAQEILAVIYHLTRKDTPEEMKLPEVPVYIDGMIDEANKIHGVYLEYLKSGIRNEFRESGENPFNTEYLVPVDTSSTRDEIIQDPSPSIILSTSGMMQGGPVIEYFKAFAGEEKHSLIFVTYQVPDTLGRKIVDGMKQVDFMEDGRLRTININMEVHKIDGFTGHSDRKQLLGYVSRLKKLLRSVYIVHGEPEKIINLSDTIEKFFKVPTHKLPLYNTILLK